jgi:peptidoglycan/LPS O-acetylase OafA/YrhL
VDHSKLYRKDLDGLRGLAVLVVVLFHAFESTFPGGFIGVDVFFFLSGYLISGIILNQTMQGHFSFRSFYTKRVMRIFPPLVLVLMFCLVFGSFLLIKKEWIQINKHIVYATTFLSNYTLWKESGYFDTPNKPLLHLWSLAIEEQFYLFFPLALVMAQRKNRTGFFLILSVFLSFVCCVLMKPSNAFYFSLARFWELLAGSSSVFFFGQMKNPFIGRPRLAGVISGLGFLMILICLFFFDKSMNFPGYLALIPVFASLCMVVFGFGSHFNKLILSNGILVYFGKISYSFYLWHWVLLAFIYIYNGTDTGFTSRLLAVFYGLLMAHGSTFTIEHFFRMPGQIRFKLYTLVSIMVGLTLISSYNRLNHQHFSSEFQKIIDTQLDGGIDDSLITDGCAFKPNHATRSLYANCFHQTNKRLKFAMVGDSKAATLIPGVIRQSQDQYGWVFIGGSDKDGQAPRNTLSEYYGTSDITVNAIQDILQYPEIETVVLVNATRGLFKDVHITDQSIAELPDTKDQEQAFEGLKAAIEVYLTKVRYIVLVVDNPTLDPPENCLQRTAQYPFIKYAFNLKDQGLCELERSTHLAYSQKYREVLLRLEQRFPHNVKIFDTIPYLCEQEKCTHYKDGRMLYGYSDHISDYASTILGKELNDLVRNLL